MSILSEFQSGCTGLSWVWHLFGSKLPAEDCCDEHDVAYDEGGTLRDKTLRDLTLAECIHKSHEDKAVGAIAGIGAWLAVTLFPYSYYVWFRKPRL